MRRSPDAPWGCLRRKPYGCGSIFHDPGRNCLALLLRLTYAQWPTLPGLLRLPGVVTEGSLRLTK
jgi:hypothetical protein